MSDSYDMASEVFKATLVAGLIRALKELGDIKGPAYLDDFQDRLRKNVKNATPEGPTTEQELREAIDLTLENVDKIFGIVRSKMD